MSVYGSTALVGVEAVDLVVISIQSSKIAPEVHVLGFRHPGYLQRYTGKRQRGREWTCRASCDGRARVSCCWPWGPIARLCLRPLYHGVEVELLFGRLARFVTAVAGVGDRRRARGVVRDETRLSN